MARFSLGAVLLFVAANAAAGTADLRVTLSINGPSRVVPGEVIRWTTTVENLGPDTARDLFVSSDGGTWPRCVAERIDSLEAGAAISFECSRTAPGGNVHWLQISSGVDLVREGLGGDRDPDHGNNRAYALIEILTDPDLYVFVSTPSAVDAGLPFPLVVTYGNFARTAATGATLTMTLDPRTTLTRIPENCTAEGTQVTCSLGVIRPWPQPGGTAENHHLRFEATAPDASETRIGHAVEIRANEPDNDPRSNTQDIAVSTFRTWFVTNTDDAGDGSLRAAIDGANGGCTDGKPCKIAFRIPSGAASWHSIQPQSPLPAITSNDIWIDGATQARYFSDTNPRGPEIEINGGRLPTGNGIHLDTRCAVQLEGLAINGFPNHGVLLTSGSCDAGTLGKPRAIRGNYIGTDPTGERAVPNGRGIFVDLRSELSAREYSIAKNVISGNLSSGLFIASARNLFVDRNVIGLNPAADAPLGNGASGIFAADDVIGTDISDNSIGFNRHFGIAIARNARNVRVSGNSIHANGGLAIDFGLDGVTESVPDYSEGPPKLVHIPMITTAYYDATTDTTTVEGTADGGRERRRIIVTVYANDAPDPSGYGEGQYLLGTALANNQGRFVFTYRGRTPGPWVAVTATADNIWGWGFAERPRAEWFTGGWSTTTSEFSKTILVADH